MTMGSWKLYLTRGKRVVLDTDNIHESFAEPYDIVLFTKEELENGINCSEFNDKLHDAIIEQTIRDRDNIRAGFKFVNP